MEKLILGVDAGNFKAKVMGPYGVDSFHTNICDWFQRDVVETFGEDDMEFEIDGRKGFAGMIARYEDEFGNGSMYGDSKAHEETKIRVLLAVHRYLEKYNLPYRKVCIVTGQPIARHKTAEKKAIRDMLVKGHKYTVNNKDRFVSIEEVGVGAEGSSAFWSNPQKGKVRILDVGSGTVNAATIEDNRFIHSASTTFNFGIETINNKELDKMANGIIRNTTKLKWGATDKILICGGTANELETYIKTHYVNAEVLHPTILVDGKATALHPVYANAVGYYALGKGAFK